MSERINLNSLNPKTFCTNIMMKQKNGDVGTLFIIPIVQLKILSQSNDKIICMSQVNTCQSRTAINVGCHRKDAPNISYIDLFNTYIRYFESSKNNFSEDEIKIINVMKDISDIFNKYYQVKSQGISKDVPVENIIMPERNVFSAIEKISSKNKTLALNSVGYKDYDDWQIIIDPNSDLVSLFIRDTGINLNCRNPITRSAHIDGSVTLKTWINHPNTTGNTEADIINNRFKAKFNPSINDAKTLWHGSYILQSTMHTIALMNLNSPINIRTTMLRNFLNLKEDIKNNHSDLLNISLDSPGNYKQIYIFLINSIYQSTNIELSAEFVKQIIDLIESIFNSFIEIDHETQIIINYFDKKDRTFGDGFIGKNLFFYLPLTSVIKKCLLDYLTDYIGSNSNLSINEIIETLEKIECNITQKLTDTDLTDTEDSRTEIFGAQKINNAYKVPTNYGVGISLDFLCECLTFDDKYIPRNANLENINNALENNKTFKNEDQFNQLEANSYPDLSQQALLNLFNAHFDWIKKDVHKLAFIPMSKFEELTIQNIKDMDEGDHFTLLTNYNGTAQIKNSYSFASYINPMAIANLQACFMLNSNFEGFEKIIINLIPHFTHKQIKILDFSFLTNNLIENLLHTKFDLIDDNNFKKIRLNEIKEEYCLKILQEKLMDSKNEFLLTQSQISSLGPNIAQKISMEILIALINSYFDLSNDFIKEINITALKTKLIEEKKFDKYLTFFEKNLDKFTIEQLIIVNINKDFKNKNELKIEFIKKLNESSAGNLNNIYLDVFKINNYAIEQKNLLPEILINQNNSEENIARCLNGFKYILEHSNNFSDFINDLFENEIREFIGFDEIFNENNLPELIALFDTSILSINALNNIINLFFIKSEKIKEKLENETHKIKFSLQQLLNIKNLKELSCNNLIKIFYVNEIELTYDTTENIKKEIKTFFENDINYEKILIILSYAPKNLYKDYINKIDMKELKKLYPDKSNDAEGFEDFTNMMDKNIYLFTKEQINDFGLNDKDGNTYSFILMRIEEFPDHEFKNLNIPNATNEGRIAINAKKN